MWYHYSVAAKIKQNLRPCVRPRIDPALWARIVAAASGKAEKPEKWLSKAIQGALPAAFQAPAPDVAREA